MQFLKRGPLLAAIFLYASLAVAQFAPATSFPGCPNAADIQLPNTGTCVPQHLQINWDLEMVPFLTLVDALMGGQTPATAFSTYRLQINGGQWLNTSDQTGAGPLVLRDNPQINSPVISSATMNGTQQVNGNLNITGIIGTGTASNTDQRGALTCSAGSASYLFQGTYTNPPMCFPIDTTAHSVPTFTVSATTLSISSCGSDVIQYQCYGGLSSPLGITTTLAQETGNNTAACAAIGNPSYCTAAFTGFNTKATNTTAQTQVVTPPPGHMSTVSVNQYLYPNWSGKMIAATQPWFGLASHKSVGYNENLASVVATQHSQMIAAGFDIVSPDWYGTSSAQSFNHNTVLAQAADLASRPGYPLKFLIMLDKGALQNGTAVLGGCPTGSTDQTTCLINVGNALFDYINANWSQQPYYATDASGNPIVTTFIDETSWSGSNWSSILSAWHSHVTAYSKPMKLVKEFGNFTEAGYDGAYMWPQPPPTYSASNQFCWDSVTCGTSYSNTFYAAAIANPSKIAIGGFWKGFDDNNASWGSNRVIAQQCGQVLVLTTAKPAANGFSTSNQLPFMQINWNDYEEGMTVETGVDNCYRPSASVSSDTLTWALNPTDATYASTTTIHHWTLWYGDNAGNLYLAQDNIARGTTSINMSTLVPSGTWRIYIEMVGMPLIINRMSNVSTYTH